MGFPPLPADNRPVLKLNKMFGGDSQHVSPPHSYTQRASRSNGGTTQHLLSLTAAEVCVGWGEVSNFMLTFF